jgi:hypothetical protein
LRRHPHLRGTVGVYNCRRIQGHGVVFVII